MRLSTSMIYDITKSSIQTQRSKNVAIGQQMASSRRIVTPSDDPRAAAHALVVAHSASVNEHLGQNRVDAERHLKTEESELASVTKALQAAKPLLVQAGNGVLDEANLKSVAKDLEGVYNQLLGSANAQDGNGNYIFSGFDSKTKAYDGGDGSLSFNGDGNQRELQVGASRRLATNDPGNAVFGPYPGQYSGSADTANNGTGKSGRVDLLDTTSSQFGDSFKIEVTDGLDSNGRFEIQITNTNTNTVEGSMRVKPGETFTFGDHSLKTNISGQPDQGDIFTFSHQPIDDPNGELGDNLLNNIYHVIEALNNADLDTDQGRKDLTDALDRGNRQLDFGLDQVLSVRATLGARLNELDVLNQVGDNRKLNYKQTLSDIQDLDYTEAISEFALSKIALQASMLTYQQIDQLSLFNMS